MNNLSNSNLEKLLAEATKGPWVMVPWHIEEGPSAVRKADSSEYVCNTASDATASLIALTPDLAAEVLRLRKALETAVGHIDHMAAWITQTNGSAIVKGLDSSESLYWFESLGEDMPDIRAALDHQERSE